METVNEILLRTSLLFLWGASIVGVIVGIAMLMFPDSLDRMNKLASHWVDIEAVEEALDKPRWTERFFYKHHRLTGAFFCIGGLMILYTFLVSSLSQKFYAFLARDLLWAAKSAEVALVMGGAVSVIVGLLMFVRPSTMRKVENVSNKWISTEPVLTFFNGTNHSFERLIGKHRKKAALILIVGGLYITCVLGYYLWLSNVKPW